MKFKFHHPEPKEGDSTGPKYWRSLDDLVGSPFFQEWMEREFPQGASTLEGVDRRHFLKIMAASFALAGAGMAGCRRPEQHILPYSKQPERVVPGVPVYYASSLPGSKDNIPLVVETHQNRPTKIEGNESYVPYGGSTSIFAQASLLDLYDPDRATESRRGSGSLSRAQVNDLLESIHDKFGPTSGQGLAFLADESTSPTRARLVAAFREKFPRAFWVEYEPASSHNPEIAAQRLWGKRLRPHYNLNKANRILSLEADLLHTEPGHIQYARDFADARRIYASNEVNKMNRLYQAESYYSITGGMADHRLRLASGQVPALVALLTAEVLTQTQTEPAFVQQLKGKADALKVEAKWVEECVADLWQHKGNALVVAGSHLPVEVHQLIYFINDLLSANGNTVNYLEVPDSKAATLSNLAQAIEKDRVQTLVILGGNPAYNAPADLNWERLQEKVPEVVRYGYYFDETSRLATFHIAATHYLESWGDGRTFDGTLVPVQPMIQPLFNGLQESEFLARLAGLAETDPYGLAFDTFSGLTDERDKQKAFNRFLNNGLLKSSGFKASNPRVDLNAIKKNVAEVDLTPPSYTPNNLEVRIIPDHKVWDGRYNNNGWLQECPEPMTKITWDNAIAISPRLAKELNYEAKQKTLRQIAAKNANTFVRGHERAPIAELSLHGTTIRGPIHVQPGLANYTVVVPMGYGRREVGRIGKGTGFTIFPLLHSQSPAYGRGARLRLTDEAYPLANTQEHWSLEGRAILREAHIEDYEKHPHFAEKMGIEAHSPPVYGVDKNQTLQWKTLKQPRGNSLYVTPTFGGAQQWGMSIDLNTCIGCNACVIACQSENNIPIVGKDQVMRGREMHWIRLDRYYASGDTEENKHTIPEDPQVSLQPMLCQHCETAPCEQVCPVNATVHNEEGLNVMAYNRCVGTRYCSNNCPYKVRRFNFFDWNKRNREDFYQGPFGRKGMTELKKMQHNPDVTVRMRGVMEKCTYCQQRIEEAKIKQKVTARDSDAVKVPDGAIKTACQQVCPTRSIVFGDVAEPNTQVSKIKTSDRDYAVLGYLNTRPRTTYLAKLRNPNPRMPDYKNMPLNRMEYEKKFGHGQYHDGGATHAPGTHKKAEATVH